jgi:hypothetical protein
VIPPIQYFDKNNKLIPEEDVQRRMKEIRKKETSP